MINYSIIQIFIIDALTRETHYPQQSNDMIEMIYNVRSVIDNVVPNRL